MRSGLRSTRGVVAVERRERAAGYVAAPPGLATMTVAVRPSRGYWRRVVGCTAERDPERSP